MTSLEIALLLVLATPAGRADDLAEAQALLAQEQFAEARPLLARHVAAHGDDALARCLLAFAHVSLGDGDAALAQADAALRLQPGWASPCYQRGRALLLRRDFAAADRAFTLARERDAAFFPEWRDHFHALAALGVGDEARAVALFARSPDAQPPLGDPAFLFERMAALGSIVPEVEPCRGWYRRAADLWFAPDAPAARRAPFDLAPPVRGEWRVMQGHFGDESHFGIAGSWSLDLMKVERGQLLRGEEIAREEWFTFDAPVEAPAAGRVVRVVADFADHAATTLDRAPLLAPEVLRNPLGNHLVIELAPDAFLLLAHLRHGSIEVKAGERVAAGQRLARVGITGVSYAPHLHLVVWSQLAPTASRPLRFLAPSVRRADGRVDREGPFTMSAGDSLIRP